MSNSNFEKESYIVRYDLLVGCFWRRNLEEVVELKTPLFRRKNNHDAARQVIIEKFPNCVVNQVRYC